MWREDTDGDLADRTVADGNVAVDDVSGRGHKSLVQGTKRYKFGERYSRGRCSRGRSSRDVAASDVDNSPALATPSQEPECSTGFGIPSRVQLSKFTCYCNICTMIHISLLLQ